MTSTIRACSYSTQAGSASILQERQIKLLNHGGAQDVSNRVGRLVSKHLGYKGNQVFEAEITKTKITFTVPGETRVLEYTNNKWQLTRSGSETTELPATVQSEVNADIEDALNRIHQAANFKPDDSSSSPVMHEPSNSVSQLHERLGRVEQRLDHLILHLSHPIPRHDSSSDFSPALLSIQRELQGLREAVQRLSRPNAETSGAARIQELQEQLRQTEQALAETKAALEIKSGKDSRTIKELETQLAQSNAALEAARKEHKEAQAKGASQLTELQAKLSTMEQQLAQTAPVLEAANAVQQALRESNDGLQRQLAEIRENQTRLKEAEQTALEQSTKLKEENTALLAQIKTISTAKADLEKRLTALHSTISASQADLSRINRELETKLKAQAEALNATEGKLTANRALVQQQADQLEALKAHLATERAKITELEKEKAQQAQQIATLTTERTAIQHQLAEEQERVRTITQEKARVEPLLQQARATIEKQNQELEQLRSRLEAMRAGKAEQLKTSTVRAGQEREATVAVEREVEAMLMSLNLRNRTSVDSSISKAALL